MSHDDGAPEAFAWTHPPSPSNPEWDRKDAGTADTLPPPIRVGSDQIEEEVQWGLRVLAAFDKIQNIFLADPYAARNPLKMDRVRALVLAVGEDPRGL